MIGAERPMIGAGRRAANLSGLTVPSLLLVLCCGQLFWPAPAAAGVEIVGDVVYGHKLGLALTFDVIKPETPNGVGLLFMVSGGWVSRWYDPQLAVSSERFKVFPEVLHRGFTLFLVRHSSSPVFKVPDAVEDVRRAVRFIHLNAAEYDIDPQRLGVFGGSAGGHLSLMLGLAPDDGDPASPDPVEQQSSRVAAVVAYFPPVDLRGLVGPSERFPALDFDPAKADSVSPILFVSADDPPTLLIHGDRDDLVPLANSQKIRDALQGAAVKTDLLVLEGAGHGFQGEHDERAAAALAAWFEANLAVHAAPALTTSE